MLGTAEWVLTSGPFGLYTLFGPPPEGTHAVPWTRRNDLYVAVDGQNSTTDIIRCLRPERTTFQTCDHLIEAGEIDIELYYAPEFLSDWARLSSGAIEFLERLKGK